MIQKKVCMLGAFAVGKTSLVARYVKGVFSEKYHTTIGVKIDRKDVVVNEQEVRLLLWDLHGEDDFLKVRTSYFRGASGFVLVADGTRRSTLDTALMLRRRAEETVGRVPFVLLLNKSDLTEQWEIPSEDLPGDEDPGCLVLQTSAKSGAGVEEAFRVLAETMVK